MRMQNAFVWGNLKEMLHDEQIRQEAFFSLAAHLCIPALKFVQFLQLAESCGPLLKRQSAGQQKQHQQRKTPRGNVKGNHASGVGQEEKEHPCMMSALWGNRVGPKTKNGH